MRGGWSYSPPPQISPYCAVRRHARSRSLMKRHFRVLVERKAAAFSAWYELTPRSQANDETRHGTFKDVIARLPYVRDMGFDVLYLTPIHPIGHANRKGRNNALVAGPGDPGSPYAIGAEEGGHDAIHPELGGFDDFAELVEAAAEHGLEIALDFAIQCSPDHPWIKEHPEWFEWLPDGSIRYAENPPKKYEDIVNVHFYGDGVPVAMAGAARRGAVLGRARREDFPRRQPAHQAVPVLGMAHPRGAARAIPT